MKLRSNSLFHFTPKFDYLKNILLEGFWAKFCRESGWGNKYIDYALPMVCFCDIPLSMINEHTEYYGFFGIGVSREWIRKHKTITPVQYIATNSKEYNQTTRLLTALKNNNINEFQAQKLCLSKKVSGKVVDKTGIRRNKIFYNEREWRYVPEYLPTEKLIMAIDKSTKFDADAVSNITDEKRLVIDMDSIQYLIIPKERNRKEMIDAIEDIYSSVNRDSRLKLLSKIISVEQITNDF